MAHPKTAQTDHDVLDVIRHRWSPRAFDSNSPIADADLLRLFEAARWAPSSGNEQPWRFVVVRRERGEAFAALLSSLAERNQVWAQHAPVLVLVVVRTTREGKEIPNSHAWYDAGQAVAFLTLQATSMQVAMRQMQGFDRTRAREACAVPMPFEPAVVMAIGYAGDPSQLVVETHRSAEEQPRVRRAIAEFVFSDRWGQSLRDSGISD